MRGLSSLVFLRNVIQKLKNILLIKMVLDVEGEGGMQIITFSEFFGQSLL